MNKKVQLNHLINEAQNLLVNLIRRFENFNEKEVKIKTNELRIAAERLNKQLISIASLHHSYCTEKEVKMADDIVFQLSIYDDICEGFLKGI